MTTLVWGVRSEPPVELVVEALLARGADVLMVAPGLDADLFVDVTVEDGCVSGAIDVAGRRIDVRHVGSAYLRPVEPELVPGISAASLGPARRAHDALVGLTELLARTGAHVANPLSAMASNTSKPLQAQAVLRHGLATPATLVSDDPEEVLAFAAEYGELVYKSTSGIRSIVAVFDPADRDRLARIVWCPVQFQERISGPEVRVHVVAGQVHAALVESDAIDYRYARAQVGHDATLRQFRLPDPIAERCVALAADLGLPFAGIDLRLPPDGRVICFEVNPAPGFSWYECETGMPISHSVARWLDDGR
jgi:glutathione synthase/RimK-type ligase-like ATP-grasp enzyme